jgi:hypothetical protein
MKSSNSSNHALFVKSLPLHKALQDDGGVSHSSARHSWLELCVFVTVARCVLCFCVHSDIGESSIHTFGVPAVSDVDIRK